VLLVKFVFVKQFFSRRRHENNSSAVAFDIGSGIARLSAARGLP